MTSAGLFGQEVKSIDGLGGNCRRENKHSAELCKFRVARISESLLPITVKVGSRRLMDELDAFSWITST